MTDPKFGWIARRSGQPVAVVLAVWAALLEHASQEAEAGKRGDVSRFDCEAIDVLWGVEDGVTESIVDAMRAKGLISGGRVTQWEKRQPRHEDSSRDRMREFRAKQKAHAAGDDSSGEVTRGDAPKSGVTQCDAREDKNRVDENREEIKEQDQNIDPHFSAPEESSIPQARNNPHTLSPEEAAQIEEWWGKFWAHYPRQTDKKKARETFDRTITRASPGKRRQRMEHISRRLNAYLDEIAQKNTPEQYIKYPASWLNAHDWDEPPEPEQEKSPEPRQFEGLTPWQDDQAEKCEEVAE